MPKFRIYYDIGFGEHSDIIEAESQAKAFEAAYDAARESFEAQADYGAEPVDE